MTTLPSFYVDSVQLLSSNTISVRGNVVTDLIGGNVKAFNLHNCNDLRAKNNQALRIRSHIGEAKCYNIYQCNDVLLVYNTASRSNTGFEFADITTLNVYNATVHDCSKHFVTSVHGTFKNIGMSVYDNHAYFNVATGFEVATGVTVDLDYALYFGLENLVVGSATIGTHVEAGKLLYIDEPNDDMTPDYLSLAVNAGTANPLSSTNVDIGGIESFVTTEFTAAKNYHYDLIDNTFWDVDNDNSVEISFMKAFQSRILANSEVQNTLAKRDYYGKYADSVLGFSELFPMYARYANATKYKKRVLDMWYATQNPATLQAMQNAIGGYNLYPTFFKREEDREDGWIIGESFIDYDNWLLGGWHQKYGIGLDVLGISTMNVATSGECYSNTQHCVSDIAPVLWYLHEEVQPSGYVQFTDMWNGFENCALTNAYYNDDFAISTNDETLPTQIITPLISTITIAASGDNVEISLLDRILSEEVTRNIYYRQGTSSLNMSSWVELKYPIGEFFSLTSPYIQFKIDVDHTPLRLDYEFIGLCLRKYTSGRDWTNQEVDDMAFIEFAPGEAVLEVGASPLEEPASLLFEDGVPEAASWSKHIPASMIGKSGTKLRLGFMCPSATGNLAMYLQYTLVDVNGNMLPGAAGTYDINISDTTKIHYLELDTSTWLSVGAEFIQFALVRDDSIYVTDVLAADVYYMGGYIG
jgi:hypothetical protein